MLDWAPLCRLPVASFVIHAGRGSLGYRSFPTGRGEVLGRTAKMLKLGGIQVPDI